AQSLENGQDHAIRIRQHVIVPEPHNTTAARFQPARPPCVVILKYRMLATIDFDDELCRGAEEVDDVGSDRLLPTEAEAVELLAPQARPQPTLGIGRCAAQLLNVRRHHAIRWHAVSCEATPSLPSLSRGSQGGRGATRLGF